MANSAESQSALLPVEGIRLAAAVAGIKYTDRNDVVLIELPEDASTAAVFTRNAFCAAPVALAKQHLLDARPRYLLINSGNANAGTGQTGMKTARQSCEQLATLAGCAAEQVLPFSTGVIGQQLDVGKINAVMPGLLDNLQADSAAWQAAARAIMTTDTVEKTVSRQATINGQVVTVTGMAKGSGMIHPDMATMLAYLATDAAVERELLQRCLAEAVEHSFNAITVDGDTSTNDACVLMATARGAVSIQRADDPAYGSFAELVQDICMQLARKIVLDGEGATKLIDIRVESARDVEEARQVAFTIAHSPLVKTAMFASDPNWGRILAAIGRSGINDLEINRVRLYLDDVCIVEDGGVADSYTESAGQAVMDRPEISVRVCLERGSAQASVLTCDFSYDYVKINAEYRT